MPSESCAEAMARIEAERPAMNITLSDMCEPDTTDVEAMSIIRVFFTYPERIDITRLTIHDCTLAELNERAALGTRMAPVLPGAVEQREIYCDACGTCTTAWIELETGSLVHYKLCPDCQPDHADEIAEMKARDKANELEAGEYD